MLRRNLSLLILLVIILVGLGGSVFYINETKTTKTEINETQPVENLIALSKVYGYVRYFHPSDEAALISWDKFLVYAANEVKKSKNDEELVSTLLRLFEPIAPTIQIATSDNSFKDPFEKIDITDQTISWQHEGVKTPHSTQRYNNYVYNSKRVTSEEDKLFEQTVAIDEFIEEKVSNSVYVKLPLALYTKDGKTLGSTEQTAEAFEELRSQLHSVTTSNVQKEDVRIAGAMITWNFYQHFYPYFEEVNVDWESEQVTLLEAVMLTNTEESYLDTLNIAIAKLDDGHAAAYIGNRLINATLPFYADIVENKLVVTVVSSDSPFQVGDILLKKDSRDVNEILSETMEKISGSSQWKKYQALEMFVRGESLQDVEFEVYREGQTLTISTKYQVSFTPLDRFNRQERFLELEEGIFYFNATNSIGHDFERNLDKLVDAKGIIFDIRGYVGSDEFYRVLPHLSSQTLKSPIWQIPQIVYPDHQRLVGYREDGRWVIEPEAPTLNAKLIFLTDGGAISASESYLGTIEDANIGVIIGEATAGANGTINVIEVPGRVSVVMTGMKVLKGDRSQHHMVGIQPTVPLERTMEGVLNEVDEYIEKALEVIKASN